jgi:hypothetical protein
MNRRDAIKTLAVFPIGFALPGIEVPSPPLPDHYVLPMSTREALECLRSVLFRPGLPAEIGHVMVNSNLCTVMNLEHIQPAQNWLMSADMKPGDLPPGVRKAKWQGFVGMYFPLPWADEKCWKSGDRNGVPVYRVYANPDIESHIAYIHEPGEPEPIYDVVRIMRDGKEYADSFPRFTRAPLDLYKVKPRQFFD